ncbi:MAG: septum formation protein Maf [Flavobacteriaceae bacterium]|nr:septum formation protein Maf [Flavobacteriaceae bacterium]
MQLILASKSPRRQQLLAGLDIPFEIDPMDIPEDFPEHLQGASVAEYLALAKSKGYTKPLNGKTLLTCDTIVCLEGEVINKPTNLEDAKRMLRKLSGKMHEVYTGVCLRSESGENVFSECTKVYFIQLTDAQIDHYVEKYKPLDKAGAYGVQEWIGYAAVERIEGCYYNVMGLPLSRIYRELMGLY